MEDNVVSKIKDAFESILSDRKKLIKILSIILILLLAVILRIHDESKADITIESADAAEELEYSEEEEAEAQKQTIFVDIGGAVEKPGVYEVSTDTRLFQLIDKAGGLTEDADTDHVNRASFVEDGQKIIIPEKGSDVSGGMVSASGEIMTDFSTSDSDLVNINTASADELKTLNGIGDVTAEKIIAYRSTKAFKSIEDIMSVDGIGNKTYEKIKDHITI